ncbi:MAG: conserved rane protein of unknown function [Fibrobacteres bacterium]|nr:conserved rane protein of unknown function [Fibrobacterota bacterium]
MVFRRSEAYNCEVTIVPSPTRPPRRRWPIISLLAVLGLSPVLPVLIKGSPILNNDMLVAYFCYFWDFHRNWSWSHPLVFWSSSYQCGMPMHAYWQSGYLYPVTWLLFGPLSPHYGIYLFYAFHFALGIYGFLKLGPRLGLHRTASLWAGICFSLSGTMLARYEHATFLSGWAWMPLVLAAFLALRDRPRPRTLFLYAGAVALQALGGHPQASVTTAILIAAFTLRAFFGRGAAPAGVSGDKVPSRLPKGSAGKPWVWIVGGHFLALAYCSPMLIPFLHLIDQTDRFDGVAWEGGKPGEKATAAEAQAAAESGAAEKLEAGVFGFEKFATGGMRPIHLLSLAAPHALGSPSNGSWWGGEVWGEVFVYLGGLGLFFCFSASFRRANRDLRWVWILGAIGLWLSFGAHLGASQILYHVPVFNNFRRPARFLILFVLALAALSGHGFQRWLGHPRGARAAGLFAAAALAFAGGLAALRYLPETAHSALALVQTFKKLDPTKDYGQKMAALLGRGSMDALFLSLSALAVWWQAGRRRSGAGTSAAGDPGTRSRLLFGFQRPGVVLLFAVLLADLLRIHWDHFYLFPADFYRRPPATAQVLDRETSPYWRVSHYLEYPGLEMWRMHNDPVANFGLIDREKEALSCGIHAIFGYRHVTAHLPLVWKWDPALTPAGKSTRYLFSNRDLTSYKTDSLELLGRFGSVNAFEILDWRPRLETSSHLRAEEAESPRPIHAEARSARNRTACPAGYSGYGGLCVQEPRDGDFRILGPFPPGDTLIIRERFSSEWRFRVDGGAWGLPQETADHFVAMPLVGGGKTVEMVYSPIGFYQALAFCLVLTVGLLSFFRFRKKP